jgi:hypothetical protein
MLFNIILLSIHRPSKWSLSFRFPPTKAICIYRLRIPATCPAHPSSFTLSPE